jgi:Ca2+-binding EF-hand superfamily protein
LKEASLSFLAAQVLTEKEKSIYKEIFNIFDKNNDGTIS